MSVLRRPTDCWSLNKDLLTFVGFLAHEWDRLFSHLPELPRMPSWSVADLMA
jgi:hypothetical protein